MSILIKGAKMPTKCDECFYLNECKAFDKLSTAEQGFLVFALKRRAKDCPLVEIPPHGRLIDGTKLISDICEKVDEVKYEKGSPNGEELWKIICNILETAPTIIESEEEK